MEEKNFFEKVKDKIEDALNIDDEPTHYRETVEGRNDKRALDPENNDQVDISGLEVPQSDNLDPLDKAPRTAFDPDVLPIDDQVENIFDNRNTSKSEDIEPLTFTDDIEGVKPHIDRPQAVFEQDHNNDNPTSSEDITPRTFEDTEPEKIAFDTPSLDQDLGHDDEKMGMSPNIPMDSDHPDSEDKNYMMDDDPVHPLNKNENTPSLNNPTEESIYDPVNSPVRGTVPIDEPELMDADASLNIETEKADREMQDSSEEASFVDEVPRDDGVNY